MDFSRSLDPEFAITRCAVTNKKDADSERTIGRNGTMACTGATAS